MSDHVYLVYSYRDGRRRMHGVYASLTGAESECDKHADAMNIGDALSRHDRAHWDDRGVYSQYASGFPVGSLGAWVEKEPVRGGGL
jgi:hypothetical protein